MYFRANVLAGPNNEIFNTGKQELIITKIKSRNQIDAAIKAHQLAKIRGGKEPIIVLLREECL